MADTDPAAFFRELLGQWESMANKFSAEVLKSGEAARAMGAASAAAGKAGDGPDIATLVERLGLVEARLERIEASLAGAEPPASAKRDKPKRSKKSKAAA